MPVGDVTVVRVEPHGTTASGGLRLAVEFRYAAQRALTIDPTSWTARSSSGTTAAAAPATDPATQLAVAGDLRAGETRTGWLEFSLPDIPASLSLDFGLFGTTLFSVLAY